MTRRALGALAAVSVGLAVTGCPKRSAPKYGMPPQPAPDPNQKGPPDTAAPMYGMPSPAPEGTVPPEGDPPPPKPEPEPEKTPPDDGGGRDKPMYGMPEQPAPRTTPPPDRGGRENKPMYGMPD